jgi:hypothetical protein
VAIQDDIQAKIGTLSPINVATQGLFNCPLAVAAVRGRLICFDPIITEPDNGGDSSGAYDKYKRLLQPDEKLHRRLVREDEEIAVVIMGITEILDDEP